MAEGRGCEETIENKVSSGSDIMYDFYCELCKDDGTNVEAEGYCNNCSEYLCGVCFSGHTKTRQTKHHKLLDKDSMPKDKPLSFDRVSRDITTMCPFHSEKPVEYFCKTHNFLGCGTCFLTSHRNCQDFESVLEKSDGILERNEYKELLKSLKFISQRATDVEETARENIKGLKACNAKVIESINTLKEQVIATFDRLEKDVASEAAMLVSEEEQKMSTLSVKCSFIRDSVDSLLANFNSLQSSKRVCQIYISMQQNSEKLHRLQSDLQVNEKTLTVRKFKFEPDVKFREIVDKANTLGKIIVEDSVTRGMLMDPKPETPVQAAGLNLTGQLSPCTMPTPETVFWSRAVQVYSSDEALYYNGIVHQFCEWLNRSGYEIYVRWEYSEVERKMPLIVLCGNSYSTERAMKEVCEDGAINLDTVAIVNLVSSNYWGFNYVQEGGAGLFVKLEIDINEGITYDEMTRQILHQFIEGHAHP